MRHRSSFVKKSVKTQGKPCFRLCLFSPPYANIFWGNETAEGVSELLMCSSGWKGEMTSILFIHYRHAGELFNMRSTPVKHPPTRRHRTLCVLHSSWRHDRPGSGHWDKKRVNRDNRLFRCKCDISGGRPPIRHQASDVSHLLHLLTY